VTRRPADTSWRSPEVPVASTPLTAAQRTLIDEGVRHFDGGAYWQAHESWEHAWRSDSGHDRHFLKGLIQYAAALYHLQRGNRSPAARLLSQARTHLTAHASTRWPFDIAAVLRLLDASAAALRERTSGRAPSLRACHGEPR
jgi:hypothetical protein